MESRTFTQINLRQKSMVVELTDHHGKTYALPFEFLRVYSPSAEVRGHGHGQEVLQTGKSTVMVRDIQMVGNYALQLFFDDGHDSGIYSWSYLWHLIENQDSLWQEYLEKLEKAGQSRFAEKPAGAAVQSFNPGEQ